MTPWNEIPSEIVTPRLLLRRWRTDDSAAFAQMNADPSVMEFFPKHLSREESDAYAARIERHFAERGFGLWAVEILNECAFAGFIGLTTPRFQAHFTPCVEIGWRLAAPYWNRGYATEGACATLDFAFRSLNLGEVVSTTSSCNMRSRRVMEKLGMTYDSADDFDHPLVEPGHRLRRHVLYRMQRDSWLREHTVAV